MSGSAPAPLLPAAAPAPAPPRPPGRRAVLMAGGLATAAAGGGLGLWAGPARPAAAHRPVIRPLAPVRPAQPAGRGPYTAGTTLETVAAPRGTGGYRRLADGPGWQRVVRTDLAAGHPARAGRRTALAAFVQITDLHLCDAQSPLRVEYLRAADTGTWRPQEALSVAGAAALVERVNALPGGPATGHDLSCVITTGDNCDNNERVELDWFLTVMNGGRVVPDTGAAGVYEGVQASGLPLYWQPDAALRDHDKRLGFPRVPGFLDAAVRPVDTPGLRLPWYSTAGNHDGLVSGCFALGGASFGAVATGTRKLEEVTPAEAAKVLAAAGAGREVRGELLRDLYEAHRRDLRTVTADPRRALFTREEYLAAHLDPAHTGPGPVGHGYTAANLADGHLHYAFRLAEGVLGVSLDTTDRAGDSPGSVGTAQLAWLDAVLTGAADQHVIVFSHHTGRTMTNTRPDPERPGEKRHTGAEVLDVLGRHRNVRAWINGHVHANEIHARDGFWEISTASHVDHPQLARVVELADNHDGTLSLFTTLVESAAPHRTDFTDLSTTGLASLYREISFNRPGGSTTSTGRPTDRNTELLLRR
ncbi:TIGR03767 family metallophosphoesterase [Streptantibioticus silvisoli]|uniref:TIGR03767 family metallophosphoesterase n=1 Tax=Streptantibioticus silvisoli TaxID=2705255 RepID=A0ABT6W1X4_9ACTN|nr:TIGR03767 family metallophosphoesterase [Streptantibioticus silvisoli]MDI5964751.1 TIGR03767 family metallophosphoesterase [Streptantibioticus silvisoli]